MKKELGFILFVNLLGHFMLRIHVFNVVATWKNPDVFKNLFVKPK